MDTFEEWLKRLAAYAEKHFPFYLPVDAGDWRDYYDDGYSPEEAVSEDLSYADR